MDIQRFLHLRRSPANATPNNTISAGEMAPPKKRFDRRALIALGVVVVIAGVIGGVLASTSTSKHPGQVSGKPQRVLAGTFASFAPNICPLTDTPAAGGKAPLRPAIAIKVGNEPQGARPQSGLGEADVVYDTPAEGGVMRYVAVFQCQDAPAIGPVRSVRFVDWHIIRQYIHPIFAYANGIIPDVSVVASSKWLENADLLTNANSASHRTTDRSSPDNLYSSTSALYSFFPTAASPPQPVFRYSTTTPAKAKPLSRVQINFSYDTDVVWTWSGSAWSRSYAEGSGLSPDIDASTNQQITASNVFIQLVTNRFGPYPESPGSTGDVESQTRGSGPGYILRNGTVTKVTWHRRSLINPDTFTDSSGRPVALTPGKTWVEMLLKTTAANQGALTFTP